MHADFFRKGSRTGRLTVPAVVEKYALASALAVIFWHVPAQSSNSCLLNDKKTDGALLDQHAAAEKREREKKQRGKRDKKARGV